MESEADKLLDIGAEAYRDGDYQKAQKYYEKSASMGNDQAACNLGYIYAFGRTGERDYEQAFKWFKQSADHGNPNACYKVGDFYLYGDFVDKNPDLAFAYYEQAAEIVEKSQQDDDLKSDIYYRMAMCGHDGWGVEVDDLVALKYINDAEVYSYCDRLTGKFMWQSLAKKIERLRKEILSALDKQIGSNY